MSAETWQQAMKRARALDPSRIAASIVQSAPNGLRATSYDHDGGRSSRVECNESDCEDGPPGTHSHHVVNDPTGNAATRGRHRDAGADDLLRLDRAARAFVQSANGVLWWVCGDTAADWQGVVRIDARLMPGTVQAGLDVDDERRLPHIIDRAARAVTTVERIARDHLPRTASQDEQHWTAGLGPNDICQWHADVEPKGRYRRPRAGGTNLCPECIQVAEWAGKKPPPWFMDALVERDGQPKAYERALSRLADELEVPPHRRVG